MVSPKKTVPPVLALCKDIEIRPTYWRYLSGKVFEQIVRKKWYTLEMIWGYILKSN